MNSRGVVIVSIIAAISVVLSILSYESAALTSNEIARIADDNLKANAETQVYDLSRIVSNKIRSVYENLEILANGPAVQWSDYQTPISLFSAAQSATADLTDYYMWINKDGRIVASSNMIKASYDNPDPDHRDEPIFTEPMHSRAAYFSNITETANDIDRVYVSYPILYSLADNSSQPGAFKGVVVASVSLDTLGTLLHNELVPGLNTGSVALLDNNGVVVYASDKSVIGNDAFMDDDQSIFFSSSGLNIGELNNIIKSKIGSSGSNEIVAYGNKHTLAYRPIMHNGKQLWTLFVWTPHDFADSVDKVIATQSNFGILLIAIISIMTVGIAYFVLSWNNQLGRTVSQRTKELRNSNQMLEKLNIDLLSANEQLKVHNKMQEEFVNIAAHELRTPIMPIIAITEMKESAFRNKNEITMEKTEFDILSRNARRLERLSTDILDTTRIESRSLRLNKETFDLDDVIFIALEDCKHQDLMSGKHLQVSYEPSCIEVFGDKARITQVILNLLNNAIKFTQKGYIMASASKKEKGDKVVVSVRDSGTGIDPEVFPRLFTKFATKSHADGPQRGTGLGLFISKSIINAHGGEIWAENNRDGNGATFSFSLPIAISRELSAQTEHGSVDAHT